MQAPGCTAFKAHYFDMQGPLGPEMLKVHHGLLERDVLRLYRVLYLYAVSSAVLRVS